MHPFNRGFRKDHKDSAGGFTLSGSSSLQSLARFYGLKIQGSPRATLADLLARHCTGAPRVGDRMLCDRRIELVVTEMRSGTISKVYLRIMPGWSGERRKWAMPDAGRGRRRAMQDRRQQVLPGWLAEHPALRLTDGMQGRRHTLTDRRAGERRDNRS